MITLCLDKRDFRLAKDVIQFVREKVSNRENCITDVLIASIWLTFHSGDRSQKRCGLKDLIVIDQQIQTLTSDEVVDRENTEPNTIKTEIVVSQEDNISQQMDKNTTLLYKNIGENSGENSGESVEGLSCMQVKIGDSSEQDIHNNISNNSKIGPVEEFVVVNEANMNNSEVESLNNGDSVIKIENDVLTIHIDDDFSEETNKNKEPLGTNNLTESIDLPSMNTVNDSYEANSKRATDLFYDKECERISNEENVFECIRNTEPDGASGLKINNVKDQGSLKLPDTLSSFVKSCGKEQSQSLRNDIKKGINDIGSHDNDPIKKVKKLQQISVSNNKVIAVKPTDQAQPVMILSNIFNSEAQSGHWSGDALMVSTTQVNKKVLENLAEVSPFDSKDAKSALSESTPIEKKSCMDKGERNFVTIKKLSLKQKVELINQSNGKSQRQLAKIFGVGKTQVQNILKRKAEVMKRYQENAGGDKSSMEKRKRKKLSLRKKVELINQSNDKTELHLAEIFGVKTIQVQKILNRKAEIIKCYQEIASMEKRKRKELSLKEKVELINQSKGKSQRQLAEIFGIGKTQVQKILKRKAQIVEVYQENAGGDRKRLCIRTQNEELNKVIWNWFKTARSNGIQVSGPMLQKKALMYARELGVSEDFKASTGWLSGFRHRHNVSFQTTVSGESAGVSKESVIDRLPQSDDGVRIVKEEKCPNKE